MPICNIFLAASKNGAEPDAQFDGKVDLADLKDFQETVLTLDHKQIKLFSKVVWSVSLKRNIKLVIARFKKRSINLFSTDLAIAAAEVLKLYRSRFTIEFLIRDAKQSAGLADCQARDQKALEFHWNAWFATVNLARLKAFEANRTGEPKPFSMKSIKQQFFNEHLLKLYPKVNSLRKKGKNKSLLKT